MVKDQNTNMDSVEKLRNIRSKQSKSEKGKRDIKGEVAEKMPKKYSDRIKWAGKSKENWEKHMSSHLKGQKKVNEWNVKIGNMKIHGLSDDGFREYKRRKREQSREQLNGIK